MDRLIDAELLHPGLPPRFVHPIIHQALRDAIPPARRAWLHMAAARALARDPARWERAAAHLLAVPAAGPAGERWAFDALTASARRADARGSPEQAVRFLRRALEEDAPDPLRRSALLDLGGAEADALAALAVLSADDPLVLPTALSALTNVHIEHGALPVAAALLRDAWPPGDLPPTLGVCQALASRGLREGLDLANRCGSVIETDRAMDELRATGALPRRPALRGIDALSAQERRIAAMAGEGLGNREIAEALFVTRRTVEMHLTSAYRKLGVAGREHLPEALVAAG